MFFFKMSARTCWIWPLTLSERANGFILFSPEKPGPLSLVRDIWLCRGVLCLKSQIPSTKKQTSSKLQAPNLKEIPKFVILNFGY
jgi:hypothetical protein